MKRIKLGNTDLELSNICLGGAGFGDKLTEARSFEILDAFYGAGGNFIDTANVYCKWVPGKGNCGERILGRWLGSRNNKNSVIIATKGGHYDFNDPGTSRINKREIERDMDESLKSLGLDRIDFYWLHRDDEAKPIEEILDMMEGFVKSGKIRFYGASNYKLDRMKDAARYSAKNNLRGFSAVSNQWSLAEANPGSNVNPDPSLAFMTDEFYKWHLETKTPAVPYSSTALGFFEKLHRAGGDPSGLTEDMRKAYVNGRNLNIYGVLTSLSEKLGVSVHSLSLAYLTNQPFNVIPISSVRNMEQLEGLLKASGIVTDVKLFETKGE